MRLPALFVLLSLAVADSHAQKRSAAVDPATGQNTTGYTAAAATGCKVWVPPQLHAPDYVPKYVGGCKDGMANGKGSLQWLYTYAELKPKTTWQGFFQDGVYVGDSPLNHNIEPQPHSNDYWVHLGAIGSGEVVVVAQNNSDGMMDLCAPALIALSLNGRVSATDDNAVRQAMTDAGSRLNAACASPKHNATQINVYTQPYKLDAQNRRPMPVADANIYWSDGKLSGYSNRAANALQSSRNASAREERLAASRKRFDEFTRRNGISFWVTATQLDQNPFKFEGKTVGVIVQLDRMLTPNTALVSGGLEDDSGSVQLHGITPDFPDPKHTVLLAAKVGRREAPADGSAGSLTFTSLTRVSSETCERSSCFDWLEWTRGDDRVPWGQPYLPAR